jgi:hypothetical protein
MIIYQDKKTEVYRYQPTIKKKPSKMILTKPTCINSGDYNTLPYNYKHSFHIESLAQMFYTEIGGLTRNKRCFTLKELERQRKAKGKDIIELAKNDDVNKQVSDEKAAKFFKIIKHSEYSVVDQLKKTHA